ncbi:MAG: PAS domain-containing sensor histidine kinase [Dissulfurispiraceae bacterium]|jgi:PAS domain S-box-containing protein|nr:PAS domain-containing sensor histidine kinase [Dissulfurispiraceae bacterium]
MKSKLIKYSPLTIAGIYFIIAMLWIAYSDFMLFAILSEKEKLHFFQSLKGYLFVSATAVLIFFLLQKLVKVIKQEVLRGEDRFRVLAQNTSAGIFMHDRKFIFANKAMLDIVGYSSKKLTKMTIADIMSEEFRSLAAGSCREVLDGTKISCSNEVRIVRGDGSERWINIYATLIQFMEHKVILGTVSDITESRAIQQSLLKTEQRYRQLFENNPLPMWLYDTETLSFLQVNESAVRHYGYSRQEFLNMTIKDIRPPEDIPKLTKDIQQLKSGVNESGVWQHVKKDGTLVFVEIVSFAFDVGGRFVELVLANDITATIEAQNQLLKINLELEEIIKERTKELYDANQRLMELDRLKTLFVASMTHELRTPLNAVMGFSTLLNDGVYGELSDDQKEALIKVLKGGQQLLDLVNDAIDVTKIEAGQLEQQISDFDLHDLLVEVQLKFKDYASEKGVELNIEPAHKLMHSDRRRIHQALLNLVDNAIKFTEQGSVTISASGLDEPGDDEKVAVSIKDTGVGIREHDMKELFVPFSKLGMAERRMSHGTGLGLYLTNKIVEEALHGKISVKSEFGKGSDFTVVLPVRL